MRKLLLPLVAMVAIVLLASCSAPSNTSSVEKSAEGHEHGSHQLAATAKTSAALQAGKPVSLVLTLTHADTCKPVKPQEIKTVHTQRVHLLVVDPTLTDYQHLHPVAGKNGTWKVNFTPKKEGSYRVWADVTPLKGTQQYLKNDIGEPLAAAADIDTDVTMSADVDGYHFVLKFDEPLKVGQAAMGSVMVTKDEKPVRTLQPVMGAFAHIVGFGEDGETVLHVHPMGKEPTKASAHGGPELTFHIEPEKAGFVKLFVQTRINGKDIFAPFGVTVSE